MAIRAAAGTPDQATLGAATSNYRIKKTYSELSRGAFQQPANEPLRKKNLTTLLPHRAITVAEMTGASAILGGFAGLPPNHDHAVEMLCIRKQQVYQLSRVMPPSQKSDCFQKSC